MDTLDVPQGEFVLDRGGPPTKSPLRAWDAADDYLLHDIAERTLPSSGSNTVLVNDGFGALATALATGAPRSWTDSAAAARATLANLAANGFESDEVRIVPSTEPIAGPADLVIIKVPKTLALLEHQLRELRHALTDRSVIVAGGMTKRVHNSTIELFETLIGPTTTSLARRKARLIHSSFDPAIDPGPSPFPGSFALPSGLEVVNHAGVFSYGRLDGGTELLLDALPSRTADAEILDLGCGSGVVGTVAAQRNSAATVTYVDESHLAVASARATHTGVHGDRGVAEYLTAPDLSGFPDDRFSLVALNPPFHDDNVVGDQIAWQMINDAKRVLERGGELLLVGNRHLAYHAKLKRVFGGCDRVAGNNAFTVFRSTKP